MTTVTTEIGDEVVVTRQADGWYLFVMAADWFWTIPLSSERAVDVGRSNGCDVVLNDGSVSRHQLKIAIDASERITFQDLDSANGMRLNGELLPSGARGTLVNGDRIGVGVAHIVVGRGQYYLGRRQAMSFDALETALNDACESAAQTERGFAFVHWQTAKRMPWPVVAARLASCLPAPHCFASYGDRHYLGLLRGCSDDVAERLAARATAALVEDSDDAHFGLVSAPRDGSNADVLLERAMGALRPAETHPQAAAAVGAQVVNERMQMARQLADRAAPSNISVLLLGETGVGKDVMARRIHEASPRRNCPFVALNCAAFSETLLESELFGYERGAFTGASSAKLGLLESAGEGSIFLDEIGEMPQALQAKLLRVFESREVTRVGGLKPKRLEARFIAGTNRDLDADSESGKFRSDLFYRIAGMVIQIPPLRERLEELPSLCHHFVEIACRANQRAPIRIGEAAVDALRRYSWPGNIRELRNVLERAVVLCDGDEIGCDHLPLDRFRRVSASSPPSRATPAPATDLHTLPPTVLAERARIVEILQQNAGNQTRTAHLLGISRKTLIQRLDRYGIPRPQKGR
jgi:two-component system response regulator AtoC